MHIALLRMVSVAVVLAAARQGYAAAPDPLDAAFLSARSAFDASSRTRLDALAPKLKGHMLEPYI